MLRAILITLLVVLGIIVGWHILFPILGGIIAITATIWLLLIGGVGAFCLAIALLFILGSTGSIALGVIFGLWTLFAILLFPLVLPVLLPLFIIFVFIHYMRKRQLTR